MSRRGEAGARKAAVSVDDDTWVERAACRGTGPAVFFPGQGATDADYEAPKAICRACPVQVPCLEYALVNNIKFGTWGGASEKQRRQMRAHRKAAA